MARVLKIPLLGSLFSGNRSSSNSYLKFFSSRCVCVREVLPPALDSGAPPPPVFDGTTRLYICYPCPFVERVIIARNCKGLKEKIKLVLINLQNRPAWYKEKVYSQNKVPALEHNGKVMGESLDLIKYIDTNFEGPSLFPGDPAKRKFGEELLSYTDTFTTAVYNSFKVDTVKEVGGPFDYLENVLHKFDDGPFLLGQFSLVDVAFITFVERFRIILTKVWKYDITSGRSKLAAWIEEMNKIDGYIQTKCDPIDAIKEYEEEFPAQ